MLHISTSPTEEGAKSQHKVVVTTEDGTPLEAIVRMHIAIDWDESGILAAQVELLASRLDLHCEVNEITTNWNGKKYRLVECDR